MDNEIKVMYLCDGKVPECPKTICYKKKRKTPEPACRHTGKIEHAVNFEMRRPESEYYFEKERHPKIAKVRDKIFHIITKRKLRKKVIREKREFEKKTATPEDIAVAKLRNKLAYKISNSKKLFLR